MRYFGIVLFEASSKKASQKKLEDMCQNAISDIYDDKKDTRGFKQLDDYLENKISLIDEFLENEPANNGQIPSSALKNLPKNLFDIPGIRQCLKIGSVDEGKYLGLLAKRKVTGKEPLIRVSDKPWDDFWPEDYFADLIADAVQDAFNNSKKAMRFPKRVFDLMTDYSLALHLLGGEMVCWKQQVVERKELAQMIIQQLCGRMEEWWDVSWKYHLGTQSWEIDYFDPDEFKKTEILAAEYEKTQKMEPPQEYFDWEPQENSQASESGENLKKTSNLLPKFLLDTSGVLHIFYEKNSDKDNCKELVGLLEANKGVMAAIGYARTDEFI